MISRLEFSLLENGASMKALPKRKGNCHTTATPVPVLKPQ